MITTLKTAPADKPLTLNELSDHLCIIDDPTFDTHLDLLISAATSWAEQHLMRKLITQTWYAYFDRFPAGPLNVPFGTLQSVTALKYTDIDDAELTLSSANYYVDTDSVPGRIVLKDSEEWPTVTLNPKNPIEIEFVTGYGSSETAVPEDIKHALKMLIGHWHENRESVVITNMINVHDLPYAVQSLLFPHRVWRWIN